MKKLLSAILVILLMFAVLPTGLFSITANAETSDYYTYSVSNGKATITGCDDSISGDIVIPDTLGGYPVTSIGFWAFQSCGNLISVTIPCTVTSINNYAFSNCKNLASINVDNNSNSFLSENGVLFNKSKTKLIYYPSGKPSNSYAIPDGVTTIGNNAFYACNKISSLIIPDSVETIGSSAFLCSRLEDVIVSSDNTVYCSENGVLFNENKTKLIYYPDGKKQFSYVIPNGVETIGSYAFYDCLYLSSVNIDDSVKSIASYAFGDCESLNDITIPDNVTNIGNSAFSSSHIKSLTIGNGITSLGDFAFSNCNNLETIICTNNLKEIGYWAFFGCSNIKNIYYIGTSEQAKQIIFDSENDYFKNANWHYDTCKINEHRYTSNCDVKCDNCEWVRVANSNHTYINSCDADCGLCGYVRTIEHSFKWVIDQPASCTQEGYKHEECSICQVTMNANTPIPKLSHTYTNSCDASCNICNEIRKIEYDHKITTDETITLQYKANSDFYFTLSDESIAEISGTSTSIISIGSYISKTSAATISPLMPGYVLVQVKNSSGYTLSESMLFIEEGKHQMIDSKTLSKASCAKEGKKLQTCKFCNYEKEVAIAKLKHTYTNACDTSCNICKATRTVTHAYKTTTTKATLTKNGSIVKKCTVCGKVASNTAIKYAKTFQLSTTTYTYNGKTKTPSVTVKDSAGKTLKKNTDYTVTYASGRKNAGTYKVTVKMIGKYSGTKTLTFKINPAKLSSYQLSTTAYTYDGKVKTPSVTVKNASGTKLTKNTHYTVTYASGRKNVGTYKVTIKGKGNYTGTKTLTFKINPTKTTISKLTAGKKSITVAITKRSTQVTGYQIQYSTSKTFSKATTKTISSYNTTKYTLKSLSAKKTYYVRVRTYKTVGKTKYYSGWSTYKYVKTK